MIRHEVHLSEAAISNRLANLKVLQLGICPVETRLTNKTRTLYIGEEAPTFAGSFCLTDDRLSLRMKKYMLLLSRHLRNPT